MGSLIDCIWDVVKSRCCFVYSTSNLRKAYHSIKRNEFYRLVLVLRREALWLRRMAFLSTDCRPTVTTVTTTVTTTVR